MQIEHLTSQNQALRQRVQAARDELHERNSTIRSLRNQLATSQDHFCHQLQLYQAQILEKANSPLLSPTKILSEQEGKRLEQEILLREKRLVGLQEELSCMRDLFR